MKQAFCSECGKYVPLDAEGNCPGKHPRPCYRGVKDIGDVPSSPAASAPPPPIAATTPPQPIAASTPPQPVATVERRPNRLAWVLAGVGLLFVVSACASAAVLVPRVLRTVGGPAREPTAQPSATQPPPSGSAGPAASGQARNPGRPPAAEEGPYPPLTVKGKGPEHPSDRQKRWALATAAILTESNRWSHTRLGGCERTAQSKQEIRQLLAGWWGIESEEDLIDTLTWIEEGGHRKGFDQVHWVLSNAPREQLEEIEEQAADDPELENQVDVVERHGDDLKGKSVSGWDYSRYVSLCGWGYVAGYLSEEEAWGRIMPAARTMQKTFDSWEDLGENYLVGREFWSLEQTNASGDVMRECHEALLEESSSPWVQLPWGLDLGP